MLCLSMLESSHWVKTLNKNGTMHKAMEWPLLSLIILTSEMILEIPGKLVGEPAGLSLE